MRGNAVQLRHLFYIRGDDVGLLTPQLSKLNRELDPQRIAVPNEDGERDWRRGPGERILEIYATSEDAALRIVRSSLGSLSYVRNASGELVHTSKAQHVVGAMEIPERLATRLRSAEGASLMNGIEKDTATTVEVAAHCPPGALTRVVHVKGKLHGVSAAKMRLLELLDEKNVNGTKTAPQRNERLGGGEIAPQPDGLSIRISPWAMGRVAMPETRQLIEVSTGASISLKKTKEGDGKIVITGRPEQVELTKDRVLEVSGIEAAEVTPPPAARGRITVPDEDLRDLLRAERELVETFAFPARTLGLLLMKGTLGNLQSLTQTQLVLLPNADEGSLRTVQITGLPEDNADVAARLRFITEEISRFERPKDGSRQHAVSAEPMTLPAKARGY